MTNTEGDTYEYSWKPKRLSITTLVYLGRRKCSGVAHGFQWPSIQSIYNGAFPETGERTILFEKLKRNLKNNVCIVESLSTSL